MDVRRIIALLIAVSGCAEAPPEDVTSRQGLEVTAPVLPPQIDGAEANARERAMKQASAAESPRRLYEETVDWDEAKRFKQLAPALLPAAQLQKLSEITVPVLAFDDAALLATALVTHHHNWYVLAVETDDGLHMNLRGTRAAWTAPGMDISDDARKSAANYTLTRTHGVVTLSWRAFGLSYSLNVECPTPVGDTRCTEDEFALQVVEQLGVIGGQP